MSFRNCASVRSSCLIAFALVVPTIPAIAEISHTPAIDHEPISQWPSGQRIEITARIADTSTAFQPRVYFKSDQGTAFVFLPMMRAGQAHRVLLPAAQPETGIVEYRVVAKNGNGDVFGTKTFGIEITDGHSQELVDVRPVTVYAESTDLPGSLYGFADTVSIVAIDPEEKFGLGMVPVTHPQPVVPSPLRQQLSQGTGGQPNSRWVVYGVSIAAGIALAVLLSAGDDGGGPPRFYSDQPVQFAVLENRTGDIGAPVTATDPDGDPITYSLTGNDASYFGVSRIGQISVDPLSVLDYETQTDYTFEIVATAGGQSASREIRVSTSDVDEPPAIVDAPTISNIAQTSATVSWTEPDNQGRPPIDDYDVRYRELDEDEWIDHDFTGTNTTTDLVGLTEGTTYEVQVRASNDEGTGEWSDSTEFETQAQSRDGQASVAREEGGGASPETGTFSKNVAGQAMIKDVAVTSSPGHDGVYTAGEAIEVAIFFSEKVAIHGTPALQVELGSRTVQAEYISRLGSQAASRLTFRYRVRNGDVDRDGISIVSNALQRNNAMTIRSESGQIALLSLGPFAIANDGEHIVDADTRELEKPVLEDALAAQARAQLASVGQVIEARFLSNSAFGSANSRNILPRSHNQGDQWVQEVRAAGGAAEMSLDSPLRYRLPSNDRISNEHIAGSLRSGMLVKALAQQKSYAPTRSSGSKEESGKSHWTLWSSWDHQKYSRDSLDGKYDGGLVTVYWGLDGTIGANWLAGAAVAHSEGESFYKAVAVKDFNSEGSLTTELSMLYPYFQRRFSNGFQVWGIGGLGAGEAEIRSNPVGMVPVSDLRARLGAVGVRKALVQLDSARLSLVVRTGYLQFQTGSTESWIVDSLSTSVSQTHVELEGAHRWEFSGTYLLPYWRLSSRHDGGGGVRGAGMEILAGTVVKTNRLRLTTEGRWLARHESESIKEFGASAALEIEPRQGGLGWSASLSSRLGATGDLVNPAWADQGLPVLGKSHTASGQLLRRSTSEAIDGRVGYGFPIRGWGGTFTPFGEFRRVVGLSSFAAFGVVMDRVIGRHLLGLQGAIGRLSKEQNPVESQLSLEFELAF